MIMNLSISILPHIKECSRTFKVNRIHSNNVALMMGQRLRHWPNIKATVIGFIWQLTLHTTQLCSSSYVYLHSSVIIVLASFPKRLFSPPANTKTGHYTYTGFSIIYNKQGRISNKSLEIFCIITLIISVTFKVTNTTF